jgi:hypothetical protein
MIVTLSVYFLLLLFVSVLAVTRWEQLSTADKFIAALLWVTSVEEAVAAFAAYYWHNNLTVYHVYSPIEFMLISLYFNYSIMALRKQGIGIIAGIAGILLSIINTLFIQKITHINSNFLLLEGAAIIIYCLLSFRQVIIGERPPYRLAQFWISVCFVIYCCATFTGWGIYALVHNEESVLAQVFDEVLASANFTFYIGIALIFIFYRKLIASGA